MKRKRTPGSRVREPIQVYIAADERRLLDSLAAELELSRAEILRRGLKLLAADRAGDAGPMHRLLQSLRDADWPSNVGTDHDAHLAEAYLDRHNA